MVPSKSKQRMQDGAVSGSRGVVAGAVREWVNGRCTGWTTSNRRPEMSFHSTPFEESLGKPGATLHRFRMKSAYELAMERLAQSEPQVKLTDEQRAQLGEIEKKFKAKIAEKELFLSGLIEKAKATGNWGELPALQEQLAREVSRLNGDLEEAKEKVRKG